MMVNIEVTCNIVVLIIGYAWAVIMIISAHKNNFLTEKQMKEGRNIYQGLPLLDHKGFKSAVILIVPTLSIIVANYRKLWKTNDLFIALLISSVIAAVMTSVWTNGTKGKGSLPEAMAINGRITDVGILNGVSLVPTITIFIMFFFHSRITWKADLGASAVVALHLFLSTHIPLHWEKPWMYTRDPAKDPLTWTVLIAVYAALLVRYITL